MYILKNMKLLEFYFPKSFKLIIFASILNGINFLIPDLFLFKNPLTIIGLIFFGEGSMIIFYWIEKQITKQIKNKKNEVFYNDNSLNKSFFWYLGIFLFMAIIDLFSQINYVKYIFSFSMIKCTDFYNAIHFTFFFIFFFINESYFLNIQIYSHHLLGIGIILLGLVLYIIIRILLDKNKLENNTLSIVLIILISIENQYVRTINYLLPKKLNTYYFMNMYLICFLKGLTGIILYIIFFIFYYYIFKFQNEISPFDDLKTFGFKDIITSITTLTYCFSIGLYNVVSLKITEKYRPSYNIISEVLTLLYFYIFVILPSKNEIRLYPIFMIVILFIILFGLLIFCETIIIKCFHLDKNTNRKISRRAIKEAIFDILENKEESEIEF